MNTQACSEQINQMLKGQIQTITNDVADSLKIFISPIAKQHNMTVDLNFECHLNWTVQPKPIQKRLRSGKNY